MVATEVDTCCRTSTHHQKRTSETVPLSKAKSMPDSESVDSPIRCKSKKKCLGTHISADIVAYGTVQQTSHSRVSVDQALLSIISTVDQGTSRLNH
ncbi:uncharacterized protein TNCV_1912331 [Trichonephila clavipes]|nr:uncharacterized protein TNCV_1912331 [Trichonephila clavipes]